MNEQDELPPHDEEESAIPTDELITARAKKRAAELALLADLQRELMQ